MQALERYDASFEGVGKASLTLGREGGREPFPMRWLMSHLLSR